MEKPLVSVIVPVYNVEEYLENCLNSIINQTYKNIEIILVDDGSTDNCGGICDEYSKKDNRIKVIHKKNEGLSSARNAGLDNFKGDFVIFIDSDDEIHPQYIEILLYFSNKYNADIVQNGFGINEIDLHKIDDFDRINHSLFNRNEAESNLANVFKDYVSVCNKLFSKKSIGSDRFPIGKINEDVYTIYKFIWNIDNGSFVSLDIALYKYFEREHSIMHKKYSLKRLDELDGWREAIVFFDKSGCEEIKKCFLLRYYERLKKHWYHLNNSDIAKKKTEMINLSNRGKEFYKAIIKEKNVSFYRKIDITLFCYMPFFRMRIINIFKFLNNFLNAGEFYDT